MTSLVEKAKRKKGRNIDWGMVLGVE